MGKYEGKKVAVLGLGDEGLALVSKLHHLGSQVEGFGTGDGAYIEGVQKFMAAVPVPLHWKEIPEDGLTGFDAIIVTTRSGKFHAARDFAGKQGVPIFHEIDFILQFLKAPIIAVTGTNGKTTTLSILAEIFKRQGLRFTITGGDFDSWADRIEDTENYDYHLLELSSQRLENSSRLHPYIAVLLNIFPAHPERHADGIPGYFAAKAKIFQKQGEQEYLIHEASARNVRELIRQAQAKPQRVMFSLEHQLEGMGIHRVEKELVWVGNSGEEKKFSLAQAKNIAPTYLLNEMAAIAVACLCDVKPEAIQGVIDNFAGIPHRLERIRDVGEVTFVDDSRATNEAATIWALSSFNRPVILIAGGGVHPQAGFESLKRFTRSRVKQIILVGSQSEGMAKELEGETPVQQVENLQEAVQIADKLAEAEDVVLFSPACPPDLYTQGGGTERGEDFQKQVKSLPDKPRRVKNKPTFTRI